MKFETFKFENVTSTNDMAISLIKKEKKEFGFVYANTQTKGRGTHGKKWISSKGNLFLSIFFPLKKNYPPFNEFSIINPILVSNVIKSFCKNKVINLKYPNDIFVNKKKICGILQEIIRLKNKNFIVIGIGLNIISNPDINEKYETTNIFKETKKKIKAKQILELLHLSYKKFFINLNLYNYKYFKQQAELMAIN